MPEPGSTQPSDTQQSGPEPNSTEPGRTAPGGAEPGGAEPGSAEPGSTEPGGPQRQQLEGEFVLAMRQTGSVSQLLSQAAAERIGINTTDLNCLNVIALTGSMTAGELARATGLTTASITGVLDRLEESGFVRRERDPADRRRVNIVLNASRALRDVAPVFAPMLKDWRTVAARYSDEELRQFVAFQQQVAQIMRDQLTRLRS
jgi:DNA-binding MarR family transcriptional regulator